MSSLRDDGHDVTHVLEKIAGATDDEVLLAAYDEGRILLTEDKDFGELVYRLKKPSRGIILLRASFKMLNFVRGQERRKFQPQEYR